MCAIVACHFCQYYDSEWAWWLNVGVQIFFIISGYLYGTKKISEPIKWLRRQFCKILIPYWICLTLTLISYYLFSPEVLSLKDVIGAYLTLSTIKGIGHLWFISYILFCYFLTPYLEEIRDYLKKYSIFKSLVICCLLVGAFSLFSIVKHAPFRPGAICCYMLGYFTAFFQNRTKKNIIRQLLYISIIPCIALNVIYCYFRYFNTHIIVQGMIHLTDYSRMLLAFVITLLLMTMIKNAKDNVILRYSDSNSYEIYLVHQIFILSPFTLLGITEFPLFDIVLTICLILLSGSFLHMLKLFTINLFSSNYSANRKN